MFTRVFHRSLYDAGTLQPSYWEATAERPWWPALGEDTVCDVAVIGGGYTGLATAYHLARAGIGAVVLEAGPIAWGASSRNGGFVGYPPSKLGLKALVRRFGLEETRRFYAELREAADWPAAFAAEEGVDIGLVGEGGYDVAHSPRAARALPEEAAAYAGVGIAARVIGREAFAALGHGGTEQFGALHVEGGGALHPLRYAMALARAADRHGARLHARSPVTRWERDRGPLGDTRHRLVTPGGTVAARRVVLATNGWTPDFLHPAFAARVLPALSNIVVTRPLTEAEWEAVPYRTLTPVSTTRRLLFYYRRLPDRRFLFGARGDASGSPAAAARMRLWMERRIGELFPPWRGVQTDYFWRGLVALSRDLTPAVGRLGEDGSVYYGLAYHGNGVLAAPLAGRALARAIASNHGEVDVPAPFRGLPPRFPLGALRRPALAAAYLGYGVREWLEDRRS